MDSIMHTVKEEPVEVSLQRRSAEDDTGPRKKQRLAVMVVVPTLEEVDRRRKAELAFKQEAKAIQVRLRSIIQQLLKK